MSWYIFSLETSLFSQGIINKYNRLQFVHGTPIVKSGNMHTQHEGF